MFSFHKPKIYRSSLGCCICKAKSSSSRFTDSKKYENEFERCFRIKEKRSGEICNACVLLVKRWKKLSPENRLVKHWHHVVDARAGPGTKLTPNRRLVNSSSESKAQRQNATTGALGASSNQSEVLPLSSSQSGNNQSHATSSSSSQQVSSATPSKRTSSFSKALAIDTNVSTFTFGEPRRRYYDSYNPYSTHSYAYASNSTASSSSNNGFTSSFSIPHSALSSSAFESVMQRFRQRQQQQQLRKQLRQQQPTKSSNQSNPRRAVANGTSNSLENKEIKSSLTAPCKRQKRVSESSLGSLDNFRISSVLEPSMWKREKICCGVIFRGIHNELVVFPKLLKPCEARLTKFGSKSKTEDQVSDDCRMIEAEDSPPHRTTKSGSISSCDSNTSGTGSMEPSTFEELRASEAAVIGEVEVALLVGDDETTDSNTDASSTVESLVGGQKTAVG